MPAPDTTPGASSHGPAATRLTTPDGTVLELVETVPAVASGLPRGNRTKARKHALDILFEADLRGVAPLERLAEHEVGEAAVRPYTAELVRGVAAASSKIDALIVASLPAGWTLPRMPRVDRCLARLAIGELIAGATPPEVAIEQAVALAGRFSTDDSPAFLNGLLSQVRRVIAAG